MVFKWMRKKNSKINPKFVIKVSEIPKPDRNLIDDCLDQGWMVNQICTETGYTADVVYKCKDLWRRRHKRDVLEDQEMSVETEVDNPAMAIKKQIQAEKMQLELDRIRWERQRLEDERREQYDDDPAEDLKEAAADNIFGDSLAGQALAALAMGFLNKQQAPPQQQQQPVYQPPTHNANVVGGFPPPAPQTQVTEFQQQAPSQQPIEATGEQIIEVEPNDSEEDERHLTDTEIDQLLSLIPPKHIKYIKKGKVDKEAAISMAKAQFPNATRADALRAYQMVLER